MKIDELITDAGSGGGAEIRCCVSWNGSHVFSLLSQLKFPAALLERTSAHFQAPALAKKPNPLP